MSTSRQAISARIQRYLIHLLLPACLIVTASLLVEIGRPASAAEIPSIDPNQIVYVAGTSSLGLIDADGTHKTIITVTPTNLPGPAGAFSILEPDLSPNGKTILFVEYSDNPDCITMLYTVNVDGSGLKALQDNQGCTYNPRWSPNGSRIVFSSAGFSTSIWTSNSDGTEPIEVANFGGLPSWSPDGSQIVFAGSPPNSSTSSQIYSVPATGGTPNQLTHLTGEFVQSPLWSPNGASIVFQETTGTPTSLLTTVLMSADGTDQHVLFAGGPGNDVYSWAPDSAHFLTTAAGAANGNIAIENLQGVTILILAGTGASGQFSTSPNWIRVPGVPEASAQIIGLSPTPSGGGYRLLGSDGGLLEYGQTPFYGSTSGTVLNKPIVGMAATPDGGGYWLVASDGGIFSFGDAQFYGSTGAIHLNQPVVGMAATHDGGGYWLVASDGGIFSFGDANFYGSTGALHLNKPMVGIAETHDGGGYWLVASDGGIFSFGDAKFDGSTGAMKLNKPVVGMASTPSGNGYWLVASDGGIFSFGDATFLGSPG